MQTRASTLYDYEAQRKEAILADFAAAVVWGRKSLQRFCGEQRRSKATRMFRYGDQRNPKSGAR